MTENQTTEKATLAGGCFWCIEDVFKQVMGVESVTSGYSGGHVENPTYEEVCTGETGHAEVVQVEYDPEAISYREILEIFFAVHNPTTLNRQGPDVGTQYRSAVFYHNDEQKREVEDFIEYLEDEGIYEGIVTEVEPLEEFYEAEEYHQDYYEKNPNNSYCQIQIDPKRKKLRDKFADKLA